MLLWHGVGSYRHHDEAGNADTTNAPMTARCVNMLRGLGWAATGCLLRCRYTLLTTLVGKSKSPFTQLRYVSCPSTVCINPSPAPAPCHSPPTPQPAPQPAAPQHRQLPRHPTQPPSPCRRRTPATARCHPCRPARQASLAVLGSAAAAVACAVPLPAAPGPPAPAAVALGRPPLPPLPPPAQKAHTGTGVAEGLVSRHRRPRVFTHHPCAACSFLCLSGCKRPDNAMPLYPPGPEVLMEPLARPPHSNPSAVLTLVFPFPLGPRNTLGLPACCPAAPMVLPPAAHNLIPEAWPLGLPLASPYMYPLPDDVPHITSCPPAVRR